MASSHGPTGRSERGAVAMEFALVMPIVLMLVLAIIQYGLYFYTMQGGSDIARDAARKSSVGDPASCAEFTSSIRSQIASLDGQGADAVISRTYSTAPPGVQVGDTVTVDVRFRSYDLHLPMVPLINGGWVILTSTSRVEFVPVQPQSCR